MLANQRMLDHKVIQGSIHESSFFRCTAVPIRQQTYNSSESRVKGKIYHIFSYFLSGELISFINSNTASTVFFNN